MTIKELCETLWKFERELDLLELEIQGIRFWELIRFAVFTKLSAHLSGYGQAHTSTNRLQDKLIGLPKFLTYSITRNPFNKNYKVDFLVYDHPRKINVEGNNVDIYTDEFIKSYEDNSFDVIEAPYLWGHITSQVNKNRKYLDHEMLTVFLGKKKSPIKFNEEEKRLIEKLQREIDKRFDVENINLYVLIVNQLSIFIHRFEYHKKLFEKRKPQKIYVVVSYGKIPIIAAAKSLGIKVIEFQHGVITDYHFSYNFSDPNKKLKYFPDKILTFGDYWAKTEGFPKQAEIEVYGFPYLNKQLKHYEGTMKKKKQVLFISQGTIGEELSKRAKEVAQSLPNYHFIYKLHPGEYDRWKKQYPELIQASKLDNFEVIDNNVKNLYSYFAESEFQIGVYSTAIFEGLTLNCKTILCNLKGIEYMKDLIDQNLVMLANDKKDFINSIENFKAKEVDKEHFFKNNNTNKKQS